MVSLTEKCGTLRAGSLFDRLTERLSTTLPVRSLGIRFARLFVTLSIELVDSSSSLGSAVLSGVVDPRVSTKAPPIGSLDETLSIARGGGVASSCLERAMRGI